MNRLLCVAGIASAVACATAPSRPATSATPHDRAHAVAGYFESIRERPGLLRAFLREMPKGADLHSHLSGAVYAENLAEWAAEDGHCVELATLALVAPPCDGAAGRPAMSEAIEDVDLYARVIDAWSTRNWQRGHRSGHDQFFHAFSLPLRALRPRMGDMLAEARRRAALGRVGYLELMVTLDRGGAAETVETVPWDDDLDRMREALLAAGLRRVVEEARATLDAAEARQETVLGCGTEAADPGCGVEVRYLHQVMRGRPVASVFAQTLAAFEIAAADPRIVGLNFVMPEDWRVPMRDFDLHMRMLETLKPHYPGVHVTLHAGELWPGLVPPEGLRSHIRDSIVRGGAERIGHGVSVLHEDDPFGLLAEMARRRVLVEVCLTSNAVILGVTGRDHPLATYIEHGVPVTLATDDEGVSRSEITEEYLRAALDQRLGYAQLERMARAGLEHAFVDEPTRERLLREHDAATAAFEAAVLARVGR